MNEPESILKKKNNGSIQQFAVPVLGCVCVAAAVRDFIFQRLGLVIRTGSVSTVLI